MSDLIRIYGKALTTIFLGLTALWIVALIVVPQLRMIERALVVDRYSDEAARVGVEIDRGYTRVFTIDQKSSIQRRLLTHIYRIGRRSPERQANSGRIARNIRFNM